MKNRKIITLLIAVSIIAIGVYRFWANKKEVITPEEKPKTEVVPIEKDIKPEKVEEIKPIAPKKITPVREKTELEKKEGAIGDLEPDYSADLQRSKELYKINYNSIEVGPKPTFVVTNYPKKESIIFVASTDRVSKLRFKNNQLSLINSIPLKNNKKFSSVEIKERIQQNDPLNSQYSSELISEISEQFPVHLLEGDDQQYFVSQGNQIFSFIDEDEGFYQSATSMNAIFTLPGKLKNKGDFIVSMLESFDNDLLFLTQQGVVGRLNKRLKKLQYLKLNAQENWGNTLLEVTENRLIAVSDRAVYSIDLNEKLSNSIVNRTPLHMQATYPIELEQAGNRILFRVSDNKLEKDVLHIVTYADELQMQTVFVAKDLNLFLDDYSIIMDVVDPLLQNTSLKSVSIASDLTTVTNWKTAYPVTRAAKNPNKQNIFVLRAIQNMRRLEVLEKETGKLIHSITLENDSTMIPYSAEVVRIGENIAIYGSLFQLNAVEYYWPKQ